MTFTQHQITEFVNDCIRNGLVNIHLSDRILAKKYKMAHMRSGQISPKVSREGAAARVLAYAYDDLGNIWALCKDGICRSFLRNSRSNKNI